MWRWWLFGAMALMWVGVFSFPLPAWAQEQANFEDLERKYQDALSQLRAAQDRKNELATENDQLRARLAELEQQLDDRDRQIADHARETFFLRSHYAMWESFIQRYPELASRWKIFLEADLFSPVELPEFSPPGGAVVSDGGRSRSKAK